MKINDDRKVILIHLTDFHFGDQTPVNYASGNVNFQQVVNLIIMELRSYRPTNLIIAVGGDIADKADEYQYQAAREFFRMLNDAFDHIGVDYIICPGNHDINTNASEKFGTFNQFARALARTHEFVYNADHTAGMVEMHGWSFITTNTAFREDTRISEVNLSHLKQKLEAAKNPILLMLHHHLIPIYLNDNSLVSNALDLFKTVLGANVKLLLHGHVHSTVRIHIGNGIKQIPIIGCGALLPKLSGGYLNQFNVFDLQSDGIFEVFPYAITNDSPYQAGPSLIKKYLD